jgi:hypothetical protein
MINCAFVYVCISHFQITPVGHSPNSIFRALWNRSRDGGGGGGRNKNELKIITGHLTSLHIILPNIHIHVIAKLENWFLFLILSILSRFFC